MKCLLGKSSHRLTPGHLGSYHLHAISGVYSTLCVAKLGKNFHSFLSILTKLYVQIHRSSVTFLILEKLETFAWIETELQD